MNIKWSRKDDFCSFLNSDRNDADFVSVTPLVYFTSSEITFEIWVSLSPNALFIGNFPVFNTTFPSDSPKAPFILFGLVLLFSLVLFSLVLVLVLVLFGLIPIMFVGLVIMFGLVILFGLVRFVFRTEEIVVLVIPVGEVKEAFVFVALLVLSFLLLFAELKMPEDIGGGSLVLS